VIFVEIVHSGLVFEADWLGMTVHIGFVEIHQLDEGIYSDHKIVAGMVHLHHIGQYVVLGHMIAGWTYSLVHFGWLAAMMVYPDFQN
jgi:hypothetical protein